MKQDGPARRSYSEREIGALIVRATELYEEAIGGSDRRLSLEEIEHIAAELGVPPEHMRTAALELDSGATSEKSFSVFGGPFVINHALVIDEKMTQAQWEDIVMDLREFTGKRGHIDEVGAAREWTHTIGEGDQGFNLSKTRVAIRPNDGQTSVQIRKNYAGTAVPAYVVAFLVSAFLMVSLANIEGWSGPTALALTGGGAAAALASVRALIWSWSRRQRYRLKELAERLRDNLSSSSTPDDVEEPAPKLTIPELDYPERSTEERQTRLRS